MLYLERDKKGQPNLNVNMPQRKINYADKIAAKAGIHGSGMLMCFPRFIELLRIVHSRPKRRAYYETNYNL